MEWEVVVLGVQVVVGMGRGSICGGSIEGGVGCDGSDNFNDGVRMIGNFDSG